jgi:AcrR family transcriptional regulator
MSSKRAYRSERRAEQAIETRRAIRRAARELFEVDGFAGTTVAAIAARARVSVQTIYATFGSKGGILHELMDELEELAAAGEDLATPMLQETDPRRQLGLFAHWIRLLFERGSPLLRATLSAHDDPDVQAMVATGNGRRLEGTTMLVGGWHAAGAILPVLTVRSGAETLWLLTSAEVYLNAVDGLGMDADAYERWLVETASQHLFAAPEETGTDRAASTPS